MARHEVGCHFLGSLVMGIGKTFLSLSWLISSFDKILAIIKNFDYVNLYLLSTGLAAQLGKEDSVTSPFAPRMCCLF